MTTLMFGLTSQELFLFCFSGAWAVAAGLGWVFLIRPEQARKRAAELRPEKVATVFKAYFGANSASALAKVAGDGRGQGTAPTTQPRVVKVTHFSHRYAEGSNSVFVSPSVPSAPAASRGLAGVTRRQANAG